MKKTTLAICLILTVSFFFTSCIGEDVVSDKVSPEVRILNAVSRISVSDSYQLNATFFNAVGKAETTNINWTSSNEAVATIDGNGLLTGISEGETIVKATVDFNATIVEDSSTMTIVLGEVNQDPIGKSGTIETTSSYALTGKFTLSEIENSNNLLLSIAEGYNASTSLPGLYVYLTNNPNSIANALSLGPVSVFNGAHTYTINNAGLNDYSYLLYWCEPFGVKVGGGAIND